MNTEKYPNKPSASEIPPALRNQHKSTARGSAQSKKSGGASNTTTTNTGAEKTVSCKDLSINLCQQTTATTSNTNTTQVQ